MRTHNTARTFAYSPSRLVQLIHATQELWSTLGGRAVVKNADDPERSQALLKKSIAREAYGTKTADAKLSRLVNSDTLVARDDHVACLVDACFTLLRNRYSRFGLTIDDAMQDLAEQMRVSIEQLLQPDVLLHPADPFRVSVDRFGLTNFLPNDWWATDFSGAHTDEARCRARDTMRQIEDISKNHLSLEDETGLAEIAVSAAAQFLPGTRGHLDMCDRAGRMLERCGVFAANRSLRIEPSRLERTLRIEMKLYIVQVAPHYSSPYNYLRLALGSSRIQLACKQECQARSAVRGLLYTIERRLNNDVPPNLLVLQDAVSCYNIARSILFFSGHDLSTEEYVRLTHSIEELSEARSFSTTDLHEIRTRIAQGKHTEAAALADIAIKRHSNAGHIAQVQLLSALRVQLAAQHCCPISDPSTIVHARAIAYDHKRLPVTSHSFDVEVVRRHLGCSQ